MSLRLDERGRYLERIIDIPVKWMFPNFPRVLHLPDITRKMENLVGLVGLFFRVATCGLMVKHDYGRVGLGSLTS